MSQEREYAMKTRVERWGGEEVIIHGFKEPPLLRERTPYDRVKTEEDPQPLDTNKPNFFLFDPLKYQEHKSVMHDKESRRGLKEWVKSFRGQGRQLSKA